MADALHIDFLQQSKHGLDIDLGRLKQGFRSGLAAQLSARLVKLGIVVVDIKNLAAEGEAVGMNARGCQGNYHISRLHTGVVKYLLLIHNTYGKACKVVLLNRHHLGMLGSFTADKCGARLNTALGNTADDGSDLFGNILSAGNIIKEKQRLCAYADDIIDAHCNCVNTNGVVLVHKDSHLYLCSATIGARNQNRLFYARKIKSKATTETAYIIKASFVFGACNVLFHQLDCLVTGCNINTGSGIAGRL